jgi:hypothetical protein
MYEYFLRKVWADRWGDRGVDGRVKLKYIFEEGAPSSIHGLLFCEFWSYMLLCLSFYFHEELKIFGFDLEVLFCHRICNC